MGRLLLRLLINAVALWLTTLILNPHLTIQPYDKGTVAFILTLLLVAAIFGIVNAIIGGIVRIVALPLYILTLGLISLIVNGLLLLLAAWISGLGRVRPACRELRLGHSRSPCARHPRLADRGAAAPVHRDEEVARACIVTPRRSTGV